MNLSRNLIALAGPYVCVVLVLFLTGCGWDPGYPETTNSRVTRSTPQVQPQARPGAYVVRRGDTLYGIAFRFGLNHHAVASWNRLRTPYTIYPGQKLRLTAPPGAAVAAVPSRAAPRPAQPVRPAPQQTKSTPRPSQTKPPPAAPKHWQWPANGKVVSTFLANDPARKGIDIAGQDGQPIRAVADGQIVYSGNGLVGYGELVIIKHSESLLSAYGHNKKRLVSEGDNVKAGQSVAEMGNTGSETTKLHFEMRINGVPVDPQRYLPNR